MQLKLASLPVYVIGQQVTAIQVRLSRLRCLKMLECMCQLRRHYSSHEKKRYLSCKHNLFLFPLLDSIWIIHCFTIAQASSDTSSPHSAKHVFTNKTNKQKQTKNDQKRCRAWPRSMDGKESFNLHDNRTDPTLPIQLLNTQWDWNLGSYRAYSIRNSLKLNCSFTEGVTLKIFTFCSFFPPPN